MHNVHGSCTSKLPTNTRSTIFTKKLLHMAFFLGDKQDYLLLEVHTQLCVAEFFQYFAPTADAHQYLQQYC